MLYIIFSAENLIIKKTSQTLELPEVGDIKNIIHALKIIRDDEEAFVAYLNEPNFSLQEFQLDSINLRQSFAYFDNKTNEKIIYYLQLSHYYQTHQFCGICGHKLIKTTQAAFLFCESCQHEVYPKLSPCVIVRITQDDKILLARSPHFPAHVWALIAGFVELGESLEEAIHREVKEEVGIEIKNIQYWGSQSWPIPTSSLMIGFTAEYKSGDLQIDNHEIVQAGFFTKDTIPGKPPTHFSIASQMIEEFLAS